MQENLFIGNLSFNTNDESLKDFFESVGTVKSARVITDRDSGRSRGFGFVEFEDTASNQKAIDELNGKELDGREISVSVAKAKSEGGGGGNRGGGNTFRRSYR
jgi:RNA recognition motif-containing protein